MPGPAKERLAAGAQRSQRQNLAFAAETARLQERFAAAGIPMTVIKGLPLSLLIYGDLGLRHARDIDLLVPLDKARAADAVVAGAGFRRRDPPADISEEQTRLWIETRNDFAYRHRRLGLVLELHWRLFANAALLPDMPDTGVRQVITLPNGVAIEALAGDDLFAYLCAHGAVHRWFRLKWLADIAAILARETPEGIVRLYRAAETRGAGPYAAQAMLLCRRLLGSELPATLAETFGRDRHVLRLERMAFKALTAGDCATEPSDLPLEGVREVAARFLIGRGWRYWLAEFNIHRRSVYDMSLLPLPRPLHFLYLPLRLPLWIVRRARRARRSAD